MRTLKMSWNTEEGRLVCRWVQPEEYKKSDAVLTGLASEAPGVGRQKKKLVLGTALAKPN